MVVTRNEWGDRARGKGSVAQAALHHLADMGDGHEVLRELSRFAERCSEEGNLLRSKPETSHINVLKKNLLEVVPNRDLARLAPFLFKVEHPLFARHDKNCGGGERPRRRHGRRCKSKWR